MLLNEKKWLTVREVMPKLSVRSLGGSLIRLERAVRTQRKRYTWQFNVHESINAGASL